MNNIISEVEELKELIIDSDEYKEYKKYSDLLENNKEIQKLINNYTTLQKEIVLLEYKKEDTSNKEKKLDLLFNKLTSINDYNKYLEASKRLNKLITNIQNNFQEFFDSLVS